jgi:hypothetical protein
MLTEAKPSGQFEDLADRHVGEQRHRQDDPEDDLMSQSTLSRLNPVGGRECLLNLFGTDNVFESGQPIENSADFIGRQGALSLWHASRDLLVASDLGKPKVTRGRDLRFI